MGKKSSVWENKPSKRQAEILKFITDFQKKHNYSPSLAEIGAHFNISAPTAHQHVSYLRKKKFLTTQKGKKRSILPFNNRTADLVEIPLMGIITAGQPVEPITNPEPLSVPRNMLSRGGQHYALKVEGDSMEDEGIFDGDIVIVREQQIVENGESAVAYLPDQNEATLKKIYREKNRIRLQPANKKMRPKYVKNAEVQGKVIGVLRKLA